MAFHLLGLGAHGRSIRQHRVDPSVLYRPTLALGRLVYFPKQAQGLQACYMEGLPS